MPMVREAPFVESLTARVAKLTPDTQRQWGKMTAHEMVCHLADSFSAMLGERQVSSLGWSRLRGQITRWIALHTPLPWPRDVPTLAEVNPHRQGTTPGQFEADRERLLDLMGRFVAPDARYVPHPMFGAMTRQEWMIWSFRHVDHHLRQFGL